MRILKVMETLVDMTSSIFIMTSSDYGLDSINKQNKTSLKSSSEYDYSILLTFCLEISFCSFHSNVAQLGIKFSTL